MTDLYLRLIALWLATHHPQTTEPNNTHLLAQRYHEFLVASPEVKDYIKKGQCVPNPFFPCPPPEEEEV